MCRGSASVAVWLPVTSQSGDFVVWVDPFIDMTWGTYDLDVEPASGDEVPSWTISSIDIPRDATQTTVTLGNVVVPDAANIHGRVLADRRYLQLHPGTLPAGPVRDPRAAGRPRHLGHRRHRAPDAPAAVASP